MCAQVDEVAVSGPRYWAQGVRGPRALGALYRSGLLAVQRKAGALSYAHDPTGVRGLLSHAFDKARFPWEKPNHPPGTPCSASRGNFMCPTYLCAEPAFARLCTFLYLPLHDSVTLKHPMMHC